MAEECEEEKRRRLEEQFVWPDSPRLSYNGEEDHKNDYDDNYENEKENSKTFSFSSPPRADLYDSSNSWNFSARS